MPNCEAILAAEQHPVTTVYDLNLSSQRQSPCHCFCSNTLFKFAFVNSTLKLRTNHNKSTLTDVPYLKALTLVPALLASVAVSVYPQLTYELCSTNWLHTSVPLTVKLLWICYVFLTVMGAKESIEVWLSLMAGKNWWNEWLERVHKSLTE